MLTWLKKILRKTLLIYAYYDFYCTWMRFLTRVLVRNILDINIEGKNCRTKFYFKPFRCVTHFNAMFCCFHSTSLHSTMWIMPKSKQGRNNLLTVSRKRQFRMAIKRGMTSANAWELSVSQHLSCFSDRSMSWVWVWGGYITLGIKDLVGYILWKQNSIIVRVFCCIWMTHFRWVAIRWWWGCLLWQRMQLECWFHLDTCLFLVSSSLGYHINPP